METCSDHLRKRRKRQNKWERVCDDCEDRIIFEAHTKLESKREESMMVEEEITTLKWETHLADAEEKRQRRKEVAFKTMTFQQKHEEDMKVVLDN